MLVSHHVPAIHALFDKLSGGESDSDRGARTDGVQFHYELIM